MLWQMRPEGAGPRPGRYVVRPDICQYGLIEPERSEEEYWKIGLIIVATYPEIADLDRRCRRNEKGELTGVQGVHSHVHVRGSVRTSEGWKSRSKLSAAYP